MTSATITRLSDSARTRRTLVTRAGWVWIVTLTVLFLWFHWSFINRMVHIALACEMGKDFSDFLYHVWAKPWSPDWSHALVVPLISLYFVGRSRQQLATTPRRVCPAGLVLVFVGMLGFAFGIYPVRNDMVQGMAMIVALFGLILFLLGPAMMRFLWLPIVYLAFFIKVSDRIWDAVAEKLQDIAATASTFVLQLLGLVINFDIDSNGNQIWMLFVQDGIPVRKPMQIAEACSGLRMLMAFVALGVAMAFIGRRTWWQRGIMMIMTVPIALTVNVGRVVTLGLLLMVDEKMTKGDFHTFVGMLMLIPAAGLFLLLGWVLDKLVIHDGPVNVARPAALSPPPTQPRATAGPIVTGLFSGALMTSLVGLVYCLFFVAFYDKQVFWFVIPTSVAIGMLVVAVLMLIIVALLTGRVLTRAVPPQESESGDSDRSQTHVSLGGTMALGISVGILVTAVVGFEAIANTNNVVMFKAAVPLRLKLYELRRDFGNWQFFHEDRNLSAEELQYLKTNDYIGYRYRDRTWPANEPGGQVRLHMAYYTGRPDTVPHVAERCITAGGGLREFVGRVELKLAANNYQPHAKRAIAALNTEGVYIPGMQFPATIFQYRMTANEPISSVVYFFVANNQAFATPDAVRLRGFSLADRYSYYCKVEINMADISDKQVAVECASRFISRMMPEIMACLPDWQQVNDPSFLSDQDSAGPQRKP